MNPIMGFLFVLFCLVGLIFYFAPTFGAWFNGRKDVDMIFVINLVTGWTLVGYVICLVWAATEEKNK